MSGCGAINPSDSHKAEQVEPSRSRHRDRTTPQSHQRTTYRNRQQCRPILNKTKPQRRHDRPLRRPPIQRPRRRTAHDPHDGGPRAHRPPVGVVVSVIVIVVAVAVAVVHDQAGREPLDRHRNSQGLAHRHDRRCLRPLLRRRLCLHDEQPAEGPGRCRQGQQ